MTANSLFKLLIIIIISIGCNNGSNDQKSIKGDNIELEAMAANLGRGQLFQRMNQTRTILDTINNSNIHTGPLLRKDLNKMRTIVQIYYGGDNAGLVIPGFGGIKLKEDESNMNIYYLETKVVITNSDSLVYGCGYSLHYLFKKIEKGLSINNLASIAASAQLNSKKTQVYYSIQSYGINGINLMRYFRPTINKNFDVDGFGIMQSSIDGIHNILGDSSLSNSVRFEPEILKFIKPYEL
jgi:hypothetical protein